MKTGGTFLDLEAAILFTLKHYGRCTYSQLRSRMPLGSNKEFEAALAQLCKQAAVISRIEPGPSPNRIQYEANPLQQ